MIAKVSTAVAKKIISVNMVDAESSKDQEIRIHAQILKLTMRYMMKMPTLIQPPAIVSAILVML